MRRSARVSCHCFARLFRIRYRRAPSFPSLDAFAPEKLIETSWKRRREEEGLEKRRNICRGGGNETRFDKGLARAGNATTRSRLWISGFSAQRRRKSPEQRVPFQSRCRVGKEKKKRRRRKEGKIRKRYANRPIQPNVEIINGKFASSNAIRNEAKEAGPRYR